MTTLYRVFPHLPSVAEDQPRGALYVPPQAGGRIDNPETYSVLYLSDAAAGAIAEAFGRFPEWTPANLEGSPALEGSARALARYQLPDGAEVCNLDDPARLLRLKLHPSAIVTRDYVRSRAWALRIYGQGKWSGVRWWSYYDSKWFSFSLWDAAQLVLEEVRLLRLDDRALEEAARTIVRRVVRNNRA